MRIESCISLVLSEGVGHNGWYWGERHMAERKAALSRAPDRPELAALLERAKTIKISEEDWREQCASFVYGNAPKESAPRAVRRHRILDEAE